MASHSAATPFFSPSLKNLIPHFTLLFFSCVRTLHGTCADHNKQHGNITVCLEKHARASHLLSLALLFLRAYTSFNCSSSAVKTRLLQICGFHKTPKAQQTELFHHVRPGPRRPLGENFALN
ncbi:hypothetical protein BC567DRAFT_235358 [Phyllosticta citribraziliensis]